jgi:hypothetical protein
VKSGSEPARIAGYGAGENCRGEDFSSASEVSTVGIDDVPRKLDTRILNNTPEAELRSFLDSVLSLAAVAAVPKEFRYPLSKLLVVPRRALPSAAANTPEPEADDAGSGCSGGVGVAVCTETRFNGVSS